MTAKEITKVLYNNYLNTNKYCVQNIYLFKDMGEEDFLIVKNNEYVISMEVKISKSDFKADFKKNIRHQILENGWFVDDKRRFRDGTKWNEYYEPGEKISRQRPNKFFYCCPENLIKPEEVPKYAGLIYITEFGGIKKIKEAPFLHKEKIKVDSILCRKFYYSYLELKQK